MHHSQEVVRSWAAREEWLPLPDFSNQLHSPPYAALLNCDSWQVRCERRAVDLAASAVYACVAGWAAARLRSFLPSALRALTPTSPLPCPFSPAAGV